MVGADAAGDETSEIVLDLEKFPDILEVREPAAAESVHRHGADPLMAHYGRCVMQRR